MAKEIFAIDPGSTESAWVQVTGECQPYNFGKIKNIDLLKFIRTGVREDILCDYKFVIEQIRSYGMPVGAEIFDTVHWSGRFHEAAGDVFLMPRKDVKIHMCGNTKAKDANIIQSLRDRFAYGVRNYGKGTKREPGFFYGFHDDIWQAFALSVTYYDLHVEAKKNYKKGDI